MFVTEHLERHSSHTLKVCEARPCMRVRIWSFHLSSFPVSSPWQLKLLAQNLIKASSCFRLKTSL